MACFMLNKQNRLDSFVEVYKKSLEGQDKMIFHWFTSSLNFMRISWYKVTMSQSSLPLWILTNFEWQDELNWVWTWPTANCTCVCLWHNKILTLFSFLFAFLSKLNANVEWVGLSTTGKHEITKYFYDTRQVTK